MSFFIHNFLCTPWLFLPDKCREGKWPVQRMETVFERWLQIFQKLCVPISPPSSGFAWLCDMKSDSCAALHLLGSCTVPHSLKTSLLESSQWPCKVGHLGSEAQRDAAVQNHKARDRACWPEGTPLGLSCLLARLLPTLQLPASSSGKEIPCSLALFPWAPVWAPFPECFLGLMQAPCPTSLNLRRNLEPAITGPSWLWLTADILMREILHWAFLWVVQMRSAPQGGWAASQHRSSGLSLRLVLEFPAIEGTEEMSKVAAILLIK